MERDSLGIFESERRLFYFWGVCDISDFSRAYELLFLNGFIEELELFSLYFSSCNLIQVYIIGGDGTQKGASDIYKVQHDILLKSH